MSNFRKYILSIIQLAAIQPNPITTPQLLACLTFLDIYVVSAWDSYKIVVRQSLVKYGQLFKYININFTLFIVSIIYFDIFQHILDSVASLVSYHNIIICNVVVFVVLSKSMSQGYASQITLGHCMYIEWYLYYAATR